MKRQLTNNAIISLLREGHKQRSDWSPTQAWRHSIMNEIGQLENKTSFLTTLEQYSPKFTLAAVALTIAVCSVGLLALSTLPGDLNNAYASQAIISPEASLIGMDL